jgi:hypothetical protein
MVLLTHYIDFTFRTWVNLYETFDTKINFVDHSRIVCKIVSYLRNVFRTISAYTMLLMTFERFIALYFPMNKNKLCSFRINAVLTKILVILSLLLNSTILYLADIVKHPNSDSFICEFNDNFKTLYFYLNVLFVIFTILIPIIIVSIITFILLHKITEYISISKLCCTFDRGNLNYDKIENLEVLPLSSIAVTSNQISQQPQQQKSQFLFNYSNKQPNYSLRTTYVLIIISKWFIILHCPYFICWLIINIDEFTNKYNKYNNTASFNASFSSYTTDVEQHLKIETRKCILRAFHNLSEVIYIANYAINF